MWNFIKKKRGGTKTLIKLAFWFITLLQCYSICRGHDFKPLDYAGAVSILFAGNTAHEKLCGGNDK